MPARDLLCILRRIICNDVTMSQWTTEAEIWAYVNPTNWTDLSITLHTGIYAFQSGASTWLLWPLCYLSTTLLRYDSSKYLTRPLRRQCRGGGGVMYPQCFGRGRYICFHPPPPKINVRVECQYLTVITKPRLCMTIFAYKLPTEWVFEHDQTIICGGLG